MKPVYGSVYRQRCGSKILLVNTSAELKKAQKKLKLPDLEYNNPGSFTNNGHAIWRSDTERDLVERICTRDKWQRDRSKEKRARKVKAGPFVHEGFSWDGKKYETTGEFRPPAPGEWFVSNSNKQDQTYKDQRPIQACALVHGMMYGIRKILKEVVPPEPKRHIFEETGEVRNFRKGDWILMPDGSCLKVEHQSHGAPYQILRKVQ